MRVYAHNKLHKTVAKVNVESTNSVLTTRQTWRLKHKLCGVKGCECGGIDFFSTDIKGKDRVTASKHTNIDGSVCFQLEGRQSEGGFLNDFDLSDFDLTC